MAERNNRKERCITRNRDKEVDAVIQQGLPPINRDNIDDEQEGENDNFSLVMNTTKRGRGRTMNNELKNSKTKKIVEWDHKGRIMGENRAQFASWCGTIVRNRSFAPLKVKGWSEIPEDKIRNMINRILDYFIMFEEGLDKAEVIRRTKYVIKKLSDQYREYRNELHEIYKNRHKDSKKLKRLLDEVITKDDWDWLVAHWNGENFQKMSKTNVENRSKYNMVSCTGRTSFSVIEQRLTEAANGVRPSRLEMFEKTRTRKNGSLVDAVAEEKMAQVKELQQQRYEEEVSLDDEEIFAHVFGPNKRGRLLCEGMGPTQSTLRSIQAQQSKTMIEDANRKVEEAMKRAENAEIRIDQTEKRAETAELRLETTEKELHDMKGKFQETDKELQGVKGKLSILMNLVAKQLEGQSNRTSFL